ncbi:MAG: hypothetical protein NTW87_21805 [Planctomycetota bacterium]|nr:hypothetical protein [Planctomycetota bacterium]
MQMLLNIDKEAQKESGPLVYPVFGRGRTLGGLAGKVLEAESLREACEFLCGACMCSIKQQMPGMDLLLSADWSALGTDQAFSAMPPLLQGLSPLAQAAAGAKAQPGAVPARAAVAVEERGGLLQWVLAAVLAGGAALIVVLGLLLKARARKGRE